jgi:hypothetical protein
VLCFVSALIFETISLQKIHLAEIVVERFSFTRGCYKYTVECGGRKEMSKLCAPGEFLVLELSFKSGYAELLL